MFPSPCFTVGMVFFGCNSAFFLLQTRQVEFLPKSYILVSSDHVTFSQSSSGSSKCSLANFRRAWTCNGLSRGTRLALQDLSPWWRSVLLSRNHLPHQLNQPPTHAHNHQSTNHEHLQSLTTTIHKLTHLSHSSAGLKVARLAMLVDAYLSASPSWNSSLPVETQVYIQLKLFILLPVHSSLSLLCWKPCLGYIE